MKRMMIVAAIAAMYTMGAKAQSFQTVKENGYTLHVYNSGDVMGDASYIVETKGGLVTMEEPLFKQGVKDFNDYVKKLGKPVTARIVDYHEGGTGANTVIQPEGMPKFMHEGTYEAMMKGFQKSFGDKMVSLPTGKAKEVKFGNAIKLNGVSYQFNKGAANDFPASSILIGGKFVLMHWAPAKAHMNSLQIANRAAVAQALEGLKAAKGTGAKYFLGSHGGLADMEALDFRINYLERMEQLLGENNDAESFVKAMEAAYPGLAGEEGLQALAQNLYK